MKVRLRIFSPIFGDVTIEFRCLRKSTVAKNIANILTELSQITNDNIKESPSLAT